MRSGLFLPIFDAPADPGVVARPAAEAAAQLSTLGKEIGRDASEPFDVVVALPPDTARATFTVAYGTRRLERCSGNPVRLRRRRRDSNTRGAV